MMASPMVVKVACLALVVLLLGAPLAHAAITCGQVLSTAAPCITYLRGGGGAVPPPCCSGIKTLNAQTKATPDRRAACSCLKTVVQSIPNLKPDVLAALPSKCGVNLPYKVTPSIDCTKIQ